MFGQKVAVSPLQAQFPTKAQKVGGSAPSVFSLSSLDLLPFVFSSSSVALFLESRFWTIVPSSPLTGEKLCRQPTQRHLWFEVCCLFGWLWEGRWFGVTCSASSLSVPNKGFKPSLPQNEIIIKNLSFSYWDFCSFFVTL